MGLPFTLAEFAQDILVETRRESDEALVHAMTEAVTFRLLFCETLTRLGDALAREKKLTRQLEQFLGARPMHPENDGDSPDDESGQGQ